jgi:prepilin peptidase CpaA
MNTDPAHWLAVFAQPNLADVRNATLVLLLLVAATVDVRTLRIPNWLTVTGAAMGLLFSAAIPWELLGWRWAIEGVLWALGGMAVGLALLLPLYALRVMGAGDVKLMAMVGAFVGLQQIVPAVVCVFLAGGVLALAAAAWRRSLRRVASNVYGIVQSMAFAAFAGFRPQIAVDRMDSIGSLPYGLSICAGTVAWLVSTYR